MNDKTDVSFAHRVSEFINNLRLCNTVLEKQLTKEIIKYYLRISDISKKQTYVLKSIFSKLGLRCEIDRFQNEYLNISYYLLRILYPAVVIKCRNVNEIISEDILADVEFCLSKLNEKEKDIFFQNTQNYDTKYYSNFASFVGGDCWIQDYDKLYGYVRSKVGKFSFILRDDPSLDIEDYVQEIMIGIIRVYNLDPKAFSNKKYVDMAIANQINTLINFSTRGKRKRYFSEHDEKYEKIKALKKKKQFDAAEDIKKSISSNPDYYSTLCDSEQILHNLSIEPNLDDMVFLSEVLEKAKSKKPINDYCQILLNNNSDFDKWAKNHDVNINCLASLCKSAKKYIRGKYKDTSLHNWSLYVQNNLNVKYM